MWGVCPRAQDHASRMPRLDKATMAYDNEAMISVPQTCGRSLLGLGLALAGVAACTQEPRNNARFLGDCAAPTLALVPPAVDAFVQSVRPKPRRFLIAVGTDSALPTGAESRLQRHGPTYLFPADTALRRRVLARLDSVAEGYGDMPTLLVTFRGIDRAGDEHAIVRLGGYFVGGVTGGTVAHRAVQFVCDTARWNVVRADEERRS
jgi:hypothetical protein